MSSYRTEKVNEGCCYYCFCCIPTREFPFKCCAPRREDKYKEKPMRFKTSMLNAPCEQPLAFMATMCCPLCAIIQIRRKVLNYDMDKYICCQGEAECCCFKPGHMHESSCPLCCLFCEACCCPGASLSASRYYVMNLRQLQSDPCDNRIIWCNNCLQCASCILFIAASLVGGDAEVVYRIVQCIADCVFLCTAGCMCAQVMHELEAQDHGVAPEVQVMR